MIYDYAFRLEDILYFLSFLIKGPLHFSKFLGYIKSTKRKRKNKYVRYLGYPPAQEIYAPHSFSLAPKSHAEKDTSLPFHPPITCYIDKSTSRFHLQFLYHFFYTVIFIFFLLSCFNLNMFQSVSSFAFSTFGSHRQLIFGW